jgi:hypothetical protein
MNNLSQSRKTAGNSFLFLMMHQIKKAHLSQTSFKIFEGE